MIKNLMKNWDYPNHDVWIDGENTVDLRRLAMNWKVFDVYMKIWKVFDVYMQIHEIIMLMGIYNMVSENGWRNWLKL